MAADSYTALVKEIEASQTGAKSADVTRVSRLALRDGAIALAALSLFAAADAWYAVSGLPAAALLSVLNGLAVGYGLGLLAHEWGHFAGARWNGGIAPTTKITQLFPIFLLDMQRSPDRVYHYHHPSEDEEYESLFVPGLVACIVARIVEVAVIFS